MIYRYDPKSNLGTGMFLFVEGDYVKYKEYAALSERCERLEAALRGLMSEWTTPEQYLAAGAAARSALSESNGGKE